MGVSGIAFKIGAVSKMLAVFGDRGGDPDRPGKKDPLDCLVWRAERPGEPALDSPLGRGRPGWHVECTAMSLDLLGERFDATARVAEGEEHDRLYRAQAEKMPAFFEYQRKTARKIPVVVFRKA